ncbi:hypothetical protein [Cellulomonas soli]|uniref:Uncharacterized protein n=1 Tax=Cellulomonas soli TaxID=931535 RepID=A0A512PB40_9CELL|nr:hypothetical protein [Cellulomonas soli]NYI57334.1 hypothetical protein [Cellulomonas soli]GEP68386.1 hypothetical protein CSO01_11010 [Cellulomonas soli]
MSESRATAMSPEFYQTIGSQIAAVAPAGWTHVAIRYSQVAHVGQPSAIAVLRDGTRVPLPRVPIKVIHALHQLRTASYQPGAGTWFDADVDVCADGRITADFNYDNPPRVEFDPSAYAADLEKFPRAPAVTPAWLADIAAAPTGWHGARWQFDLMPTDANSSVDMVIDATTTAEAHVWAVAIRERLQTGGYAVHAQFDQGEDGRGNATTYEALVVEVGGGYMSIAFFRDLILWTVDVAADDCDAETFQVAARAALAAIEATSNYVLPAQAASAYERTLLGR